MKQVQKAIGRWVQRFAAKSRTATTQPERQPLEVDSKTLRQISGGMSSSVDSPTKGW